MKKLTTGRRVKKLTIGVDLGDRRSEVCVLNQAGKVKVRTQLSTSAAAMTMFFGPLAPARVVLEAGTHSPWASRLLESQGHEVLVANPRHVRLIYQSSSKSDRLDAEALARLARVDSKLLRPIVHRGGQHQKHLAILRARDSLVRARSLLINHVRGTVKAHGGRLPQCGSECFVGKVQGAVPEELEVALRPLLEVIAPSTQTIHELRRSIEQLARKHYGVLQTMTQVAGVGLLTGMRFVLTVEDPKRFSRNRSVGSYLGLAPGRDQSGSMDRQMPITKRGDSAVRRDLIQCSHYILGPFGPDTDLRRFGLKLAQRGGKAAKKRAVVGVARRLAVLMLSLWKTGEVYEPLRHTVMSA